MNDLIAYKCLECGHYTISCKDGVRCAKCGGYIVPKGNATYADKNKGLSVAVSIKDTDKFQEILNSMKEFIGDERVPVKVKQEFKEKMLSVINKSKS